jgi:hypothetical protein
MRNRLLILVVGVLGAALLPIVPSAQSSSAPTWPEPIAGRGRTAEKDPRAAENDKPAPRRSLVGMWAGTGRQANQSSGVQLHPNDGKPENQPPYTPYGLELFKAHKALEGVNSVPPAETNDPRVRCEPLGFPRYNHYDLGVQIFQDEHKVAILYQYDNRWRIIWTDGRTLPDLVDGGVEVDGKYREPRWFGYSVGKWIDDYTLEVQTVGTMPEDRVWLDNTGRPISDQLRVTETLRRVAFDAMEWSETIRDPKMYTRPWQTMKLPLTLQDPRIDLLTRYCSPLEIDAYNKVYGHPLSGK